MRDTECFDLVIHQKTCKPHVALLVAISWFQFYKRGFFEKKFACKRIWLSSSPAFKIARVMGLGLFHYRISKLIVCLLNTHSVGRTLLYLFMFLYLRMLSISIWFLTIIIIIIIIMITSWLEKVDSQNVLQQNDFSTIMLRFPANHCNDCILEWVDI